MERPTASRSTLFRGLGMVAAMLIAAGAISPAFGAAPLTKAKVKAIAKKVANQQITKRAPGLSVANATSAANGAAGYGNFNPNGTVQAGAFNMNDLTVSSLVPWAYCEDQAFKTVVATGGRESGPDGTISAASAISKQELADAGQTPADFGCPANTEWVYTTWDLGGQVGPAYFRAVGF